jgi:hypothetical protein
MTKTTISAGRPTGAKNVIIEARLSRNQTRIRRTHRRGTGREKKSIFAKISTSK